MESEFAFHEEVQTDLGTGLIWGRNENGKYLVSIRKETMSDDDKATIVGKTRVVWLDSNQIHRELGGSELKDTVESIVESNSPIPDVIEIDYPTEFRGFPLPASILDMYEMNGYIGDKFRCKNCAYFECIDFGKRKFDCKESDDKTLRWRANWYACGLFENAN